MESALGVIIISVFALKHCDQGGSPFKARSFRCTSIWLILELITYFCVGGSGPHVCALTSRSGGRGHYVVFLGNTLYPHSASLYPGEQMCTGEFHAGDNPGVD